MGQGCQTCGAYWPPPYLDVDGNTIVFTYAQGPDDPPISPGDQRLGYIGIVRLANCE
jgi:hypothetical protein